jgi:hypothetical protein
LLLLAWGKRVKGNKLTLRVGRHEFSHDRFISNGSSLDGSGGSDLQSATFVHNEGGHGRSCLTLGRLFDEDVLPLSTDQSSVFYCRESLESRFYYFR